MRKLGLSLTLAISIGAATSAFSQSAAPAVDPAWKAPEVVKFIGLKKGDKVAEIVAGRLTASLAQAVGPTGKVYAIETAEVVKAHPDALEHMKALAAQSPNVIVSADPIASPLPSGLDAVSAFYYSWHMNVAFHGLGLRLGPIRRRAPGLIEVLLCAG